MTPDIELHIVMTGNVSDKPQMAGCLIWCCLVRRLIAVFKQAIFPGNFGLSVLLQIAYVDS